MTAVARVTVELPSLLSPMANGERTFALEAATLAHALRLLVEAHPALDVHLFDETRQLRPHVLCFLNDENSRWFEGRDRALKDGDTLSIIQAVSGG